MLFVQLDLFCPPALCAGGFFFSRLHKYACCMHDDYYSAAMNTLDIPRMRVYTIRARARVDVCVRVEVKPSSWRLYGCGFEAG